MGLGRAAGQPKTKLWSSCYLVGGRWRLHYCCVFSELIVQLKLLMLLRIQECVLRMPRTDCALRGAGFPVSSPVVVASSCCRLYHLLMEPCLIVDIS